MTPTLSTPLLMQRGPLLKNRMLLAPLTTQQSQVDGRASEADHHWIDLVARGGHSLVMTCAAHVQANGIAFPGQLGIFDDRHLEGLSRMAATIRAAGGVSSVQIHHGGVRGLGGAHGQPVGPSAHPVSGARELTVAEVEGLRDDFVAAARRAQEAGFDGVEVHGAFGFLITQFLTPMFNRRTDHYGGSLENRSRFLFEVLRGIRAATGENFQIGLRVSMERYGLQLAELRAVAAEAIVSDAIDYLDLSPWDVDKRSGEPGFENMTILDVFTALDRRRVRIGASGKVLSARKAQAVLDRGCDFVMLGRASIAQPDFPLAASSDPRHVVRTPIPRRQLEELGYSAAFVDYVQSYSGFAP